MEDAFVEGKKKWKIAHDRNSQVPRMQMLLVLKVAKKLPITSNICLCIENHMKNKILISKLKSTINFLNINNYNKLMVRFD